MALEDIVLEANALLGRLTDLCDQTFDRVEKSRIRLEPDADAASGDGNAEGSVALGSRGL